MNNQSANLAKRMQLEEKLQLESSVFKQDVIMYNDLTWELQNLKERTLLLAEKINIQRSTVKSIEMDIELLNKVNKELDLKQDREFFPEEK